MKTSVLTFLIALVGILLAANSCTRNSNQTDNETQAESRSSSSITDNDFQKYIGSIPTLILPYNTECYSDYPNVPSMDSVLVKKYSEGNPFRPYRRIPLKNGNQVIMTLAPADIVLPILTTFTSDGRKIDSRQLFFSYCGGEPGYYETEHITISKELVITHLDSIWETQVDSMYNEIDSTRNLTVRRTQYQINNDGHFIDMK